MFLTNSNINRLVNNIYSYIDKETNEYFSKVERDLLGSLNKNISILGIYNIHKKDIIEKIFYTEDFDTLILQLTKEIDSELSYYNIESFEKEINLNLNTISNLKFNYTLLKEYRFSYFLAQTIEKNIDRMVNANLLTSISNELLRHFFSNISSAHLVLSFANLSYGSLYKRHKIDIEKKVKGILTNFRIRLNKELKKQVYEHLLSIQGTTIKIA